MGLEWSKFVENFDFSVNILVFRSKYIQVFV